MKVNKNTSHAVDAAGKQMLHSVGFPIAYDRRKQKIAKLEKQIERLKNGEEDAD